MSYILKDVQRISRIGHELKRLHIESRGLITQQKKLRKELNDLILGLEV